MRTEDTRGDVAGRAIVVVVEAGLADSNAFRMPCETHKLTDARLRLLMRLVRMRAHGAEDIGITLGKSADVRELLHPRRDRDHAADAARFGAGDHRIAVHGEIRKIQMAMR